MNRIQREILKLAIEFYEEALASGKHFTVAELAELLAESLLSRWEEEASVVHELIVAQAHSTMTQLDKSRTRPEQQASLIDDLDRPVVVGDGKRIARRRMQDDDWSAHLAHLTENEARVVAAVAKEVRRYEALATYLASGMDTQDAVAAWQLANPEGVLA